MVLALAGDSTITRCLAMAARSVAPGSSRPVTRSLIGGPRSSAVPASSPPVAAAAAVSPRCRGPAAGSPRRSRCRCRCRRRRWRRSDRRARSGAATPSGPRAPRRRPRRRRALAARLRRGGCGALRDLEEPDHVVREEERRLDLVDEDGPLAVHHPEVRAQQPGVLGGRQLEQVDEQRLLVRGMDDDISDHAAMLAHAGERRHRPMVTRPMVLPSPVGRAPGPSIRGGRSR